MYTYQSQNFGVICDSKEEEDNLSKLVYPLQATFTFTWSPKAPFDGCSNDGSCGGGGAESIEVTLQKTTGLMSVSNKNKFAPIDVQHLTEEGTSFSFKGADLIVKRTVDSLEDVSQVFGFFAHEFSALLSIYITDAPILLEARAILGSVSVILGPILFAKQNISQFTITSNKTQEALIADAFHKMIWLLDEGNLQRRRLSAATTFFQRACRLNKLSQRKGEFAAEEILNYAKILEALFRKEAKDKGVVDAARRGLTKLGFSSLQVESMYVPMIYLRNQLDSGHLLLEIPSLDQKNILWQYLDKSESAFRLLLHRMFQEVSKGNYFIDDEEPHALGENKTISSIKDSFQKMDWDNRRISVPTNDELDPVGQSDVSCRPNALALPSHLGSLESLGKVPSTSCRM